MKVQLKVAEKVILWTIIILTAAPAAGAAATVRQEERDLVADGLFDSVGLKVIPHDRQVA